MKEEMKLIKILREKGLTDRQIEAGLLYYRNFAKKFDIPIVKASRMIVNMVEGMRKKFEEA